MNENLDINHFFDHESGNLSDAGFTSILDVFEQSIQIYWDQPAFTNMGRTVTYGELNELSDRFASWLRTETDLRPGDRIAIQLPNLLQFPISFLGALKAGLIVVNANPLYTEREMLHQFQNADVKALVVLANAAHKVQSILPETSIEHVVVTEAGDMLKPLRKLVVNNMLRHVHGAVPEYNIPLASSFDEVMKKGAKVSPQNPHRAARHDVAMLQYTGGTSGSAKGVELTHQNLLANMLQLFFRIENSVVPGCELAVAPLPLYHIYSFTVHCLLGVFAGAHSLLITNPRDVKSMVKEMKSHPFTILVGLNTLFTALMNDEEFNKLDFSRLKMTMSGGMALQKETMKRWENTTGGEIYEAYGLTEASPAVTLNHISRNIPGTVGTALPFTQLKVIGENGKELPFGHVGELCVRGPQVMRGYWGDLEATEKVLTKDGWLKTGDLARMTVSGSVVIVDRKKDTINVSGFKVYPNELEDILIRHPDVKECAAVGVPNYETGEQIKMFVVSNNATLTPADIRKYFQEYVVGYKIPKVVVFRDELPMSNVGKVLRRVLRDSELAKHNRPIRLSA